MTIVAALCERAHGFTVSTPSDLMAGGSETIKSHVTLDPIIGVDVSHCHFYQAQLSMACVRSARMI
jgi:hypothetical protein